MKQRTSSDFGRRCGVSRLWRAIVAVIFTSVAAATGFAQQVDAVAVRHPVITDEEMEHLIQALDLNEFQMAVVEGIVGTMRQWQREMDAEYRSRLKADSEFQKKVQARIERAKKAGDLHGRGWLPDEAAVRNEFTEWYDGLLAAARQKSQNVLDEIGAILDDRQRPAWEEFLRDWRRARTLAPGAAFAAERVDLKALVMEDVDLADDVRLSLTPLLSEYARTIDPLLTRRNELLREEHVLRRRPPSPEFEELAVRLRAGEISIEEYSTAWKALADAELAAELERMAARYAIHESIRDATLAFHDAILRRLPGDRVESAQAAFEMAAYPDIRRPLPADAVLEHALQLDDLSSDQRSAVEHVRSIQWSLARRQIDVQLMRLRDEEERAWKDRRLGQEDSTIIMRRDDLLRQRQSLQKYIISQVRELLSPGQQDSMSWPDQIDLW